VTDSVFERKLNRNFYTEILKGQIHYGDQSVPLEIRMDFEERCCYGVDWIYLV